MARDDPSVLVRDLGIEMAWGSLRRTCRLYRNIREYSPNPFHFDDVLVRDEDVPCQIESPPTESLADHAEWEALMRSMRLDYNKPTPPR